MRKVAVLVIMWVTTSTAFAHKDRILPIAADGTLGAIPAAYGPVKVRVSRNKDRSAALTGVVVSSPRFNFKLNPCVLEKLKDVVHVRATGSWYHALNDLHPYATLTFYSGDYDPRSPENEYYSVTFSLLDGRILMGERAWNPVLGGWRMRFINPANKCSQWE